jgi:hypothetical protein
MKIKEGQHAGPSRKAQEDRLGKQRYAFDDGVGMSKFRRLCGDGIPHKNFAVSSPDRDVLSMGKHVTS